MNTSIFTPTRARELPNFAQPTVAAEIPAIDPAVAAAKRLRMALIKNATSASARQRRREASR